MSGSGCYTVPMVPGLYPEPKNRKVFQFGPGNIFSALNSHKQNINSKYMLYHDQFQSQNSPVLTFFSSYDNRGESPRDQMKFRKCNIVYYVEDGTIKVYEPSQRNAGFLQGCLINRIRIPKAGGVYYTLDDLNIGETVILFGKSFKIIDCDAFTKNYLREMGYRVGTPEPAVIDPVYADREEMDRHRTSLKRLSSTKQTSMSFFKSHPKWLHFYVIYNYKPHHFEDIRYASLYYDIVYHTIKIIDEKKLLEYQRQLMIGNYDTYLILKPTLVPKKPLQLNLLGNPLSPVILNLNALTREMHLQQLMDCREGGANNPTGFLRDSNPRKNSEGIDSYYSAKDFNLGITLDIFGSKVYIYDCDEFTKEFYRNEFNKELITVPLPDHKGSKYHQLVYKHNFGNPEDSLQTCHQLPSVNVPQMLMDTYNTSQRPMHKGTGSGCLIKFLLNCRYGTDGNVLKFLAQMITNDNLMKDQYFVIEWFLEDDTIEIGGLDLNFTCSDSSVAKFLKRMKLVKPVSENSNAGTCHYVPTDFFLGNIIYASKRPFLIIDADEYTYDYMERHCDKFENSNIMNVMSNILPLIRNKSIELKSLFENCDLEGRGFITYSDFRNILFEALPVSLRCQLAEQQFKTMARYFAYEEYVGLKLDHLVSIIQSELKNQKFEEFDKLKTLFLIHDVDNDFKGHFEPAEVYKILRSYPLIINRDLIKSLVFKFPLCKGRIPFKEVLSALNYFDAPRKLPDQVPYAININWERIEKVKDVNKVCYNLFLGELTNEKCPTCT